MLLISLVSTMSPSPSLLVFTADAISEAFADDGLLRLRGWCRRVRVGGRRRLTVLCEADRWGGHGLEWRLDMLWFLCRWGLVCAGDRCWGTLGLLRLLRLLGLLGLLRLRRCWGAAGIGTPMRCRT